MSREVDLGQIVPNIQVGTTTTGLPSTPASVENVGTDLNPIFDFTIPKGNTGATPNIQIGTVQTGDSSEVTRTGTNENPILNFTLEKGDTGNGIASITKTSTSGLVDTYTITFTNGQTTTYEITNGANGSVVDVQVDGTSVVDNGIANIIGLTEMKQELEDMYNLLPKVQGTGETITLDGTAVGKMKINLKGNTSQETTTGQNLLPNNQTTQTINGVTFTMNSDKSISIKGTPTVNTDYYFVGTSSQYEDFGLTTGTYNLNGCTGGSEQTYMLFTVMNRNGNIGYYNNTYAGGRSMIVETGDKFRIFIRVISGANVNTTIYPQINEGSTALPYEPYTNGASPNPQYPQDIHVVSGDNSINVCGKNLLPISTLATQTKNGITFTNNNNGSYTFNGTASAYTTFVLNNNLSFNGNYTYVMRDIATSGFVMYLQNSSGQGIGQATTHTTIDNSIGIMVIGINNGVSLNNVTIKPYVYKGAYDSTIEYEPYQGNTYNVDLPVENLFNSSLFTNKTTQGITLTKNNDGTITLNGTSTARADFTIIDLFSLKGDNKIASISKKSGTTTGNVTFGIYDSNWTNGKQCNITSSSDMGSVVLSSEITYTKCFIRIESGITLSNLTIALQIEQGTKTNSYTPYGTTPIELCKIGDYQDSIVKDNGKWYLNKQIGKYKITGQESGSVLYWNNEINGMRLKLDNAINTIANAPLLCNRFKAVQGTSQDNNYVRLNRTTGENYIGFWFGNVSIEGVNNEATFKTYASSNDIILSYPLNTPTYTEITDSTLLSQLDTIKRSYDEQTNINQENNDLPFILDVTALKQLTQ